MVKLPPNHWLQRTLSKDLVKDEKQGPNISPHLAVIVNNFWQQNISGDKSKIGSQNIQYQKIVTKSLFQDAMRRFRKVRMAKHNLAKDYNANQKGNLSYH